MRLYTRDNTRRSIFHTALFRAVSQLGTVIGFVIMVRSMSELDFGVFHLLYTLIPLISAGASLGLEHVLRRYQPEYLSTGKTTQAAWLVRFVGRARFGANLTVLVLIFIFWHSITPLFELETYRSEYLVFSVLILLFFQFRVLEISLSSHMLHRISMGMQAMAALIKLAGYAVFGMLGDLTLHNAIMVDTAAFGIAYVGLYFFYRRHCIPSESPRYTRLPRTERRRLLRYGLFYNFNDAGTLSLRSRMDNLFIAAILDPLAVGVYAFYSRLTEMARHLLPINLFLNVVQPVFFSIPKEHSGTRLPRYFTLLLNTSLIVNIPLAAFALAFHEEIVDVVFAGRFIADSWLLPLLMLFTTINTIATPVTLAAQHQEKAAIILISKVFGLYNFAALIALIPMFGVYGAAMASGTAQLFKNCFIWWHVRHNARWLNFGHVLLATCAYWGLFYGLVVMLRGSTAWHPLALLAAGGTAWLLFLLAFLRSAALNESDREILGKVMRGRERRLLRLLGISR